MSKRKHITYSRRIKIAGKQYFKCANNPNLNMKLKGVGNYNCPLWSKNDENRGNFDESGFEIDHITEWCISQDDKDENLQALCLSCHRVKTKNFARERKKKCIKKIYIK